MADNTNEGNNDYVQIIQNAQNVLEHLETLQNKIREYSNKNASMKESYELIAELTLNLSNVCKQLNETSKSFRKSGPEEISTSLENLTNSFVNANLEIRGLEKYQHDRIMIQGVKND